MGGRSREHKGVSWKKPSEREFEWDEAKSKSNKEKHGIDFEEAKALWEDKSAVDILASYTSEARWFLTAKYNGKLYRAVYTVRQGIIRIISVRRVSKKKETEDYEKKNKND